MEEGLEKFQESIGFSKMYDPIRYLLDYFLKNKMLPVAGSDYHLPKCLIIEFMLRYSPSNWFFYLSNLIRTPTQIIMLHMIMTMVLRMLESLQYKQGLNKLFIAFAIH